MPIRWWKWPRSGVNGDLPLSRRRVMIQKVSMMGTPRMSSGTARAMAATVFITPMSEIVASAKPLSEEWPSSAKR